MVNFIQNILNEKDEKVILKRASFWNAIASMLNSTLSSILLFFITRLSGVTAAGIFSIASAIAYQCLSMGNFGSRNFQVSDVKKEFSFSDYVFIRVISAVLMYSFLLYYAFGSGYQLEKALVVLTFGIFKSIDAIEDIVHGEYHRENRLDVAAILLTIRYVVSIILFIAIYAVTRNLVITSAVVSIFTIIIFIVENKKIIPYFVNEKLKFNFGKVKNLLFCLLPICISNYIRMYTCNLPKYSIDANLNESAQAYFNVLIMPVFIITLLSDVIFRPFITKLSVFWNNNNLKEFVRLIIYQVSFIIFITFGIMIGGYVIGLRLLEIVYGLDLHQYMLSLMILLFAGGFNTVAAFFTLVLTIQREQKKLVFVYVTCAIIAIIISDYFVINYHILGASILYFIICFSMSLLFLIIVIRKIRKQKIILNQKK